tara:strand:+ start:179 stop:1645 length:1467 start_codon:yes stop_codon:yes gene_type:complete
MKKLIFIVFALVSVQFNAQQNLKFKIVDLQDTTVFLARYFGERLYYADTAISKNQNVVFNTKKLVGGVYAVVCPGSKYFEFIVTDEDVIMETKLDDFIGSMKVIKSENNKIFYGYINYLNQKKNEAKSFMENKEKMAALDKEVKDYQKNNILDKTEFFGAKVLAMSIDIKLPEKFINNDTLKYNYIIRHFWDNIDLKDNRIVHTPVFHNKLDQFFKMIPNHPDTICKYSYKIIDEMDPKSDLFKYTVHHITYKYETSNVMGMDAVFVCMAQKYYCPAESTAAFWLDSTKLVDLCDKASKLEPLLVGKNAPRIILADTSQENWVDFYQLKNKYNLLIFWDPDCGHCKKEIPKLLKLYHELKEKNIDIEFIGYGTNLENEDWRKFIRDKKLDWLNLSDFPDANENPTKYLFDQKVTDLKSLNFRKTYDIFSTPQVYLVDKDKKIIGKKLDALTLATMMEHIEDVKIEYKTVLEEQQKKEKEKKEESKNKK